MTIKRTQANKPERALFREPASAKAPLAFDPEAFGFMFETESDKSTDVVAGVAVVTIEGPLEHKGSFWWDSYESISQRFYEALNDENVSGVILKIDSPGGVVAGCFETVAMLRAAKEASGKRVVAYVDESCYSAAYALATVADEIYVPRSGGVGSIGVIQVVCDRTKANEKAGYNFAVITAGAQKGDLNPDLPLSKEALTRAQSRVDMFAEMFFELVSTGRPLTAEEAKALEAGCFYGSEAVKAGLADAVASLEEVIGSFSSEKTKETDMKATPKAKQGMEASRKLGVKSLAKKCEDESKAEEEAEEEEEEKKADSSGELPESEKDDSSGDVGDEDDDEEDEEEEKKASAGVSDLVDAVRALTGEKSISAMIGALHAQGVAYKSAKSLRARVAELEAAAHKTTVEAVVRRAMKDGKLAPAQKAWALEAGIKDLEMLRGYLDSAPAQVATAGSGFAMPEPKSPKDIAPEAKGVTKEEADIAAKMHINLEDVAAFKTANGMH